MEPDDTLQGEPQIPMSLGRLLGRTITSLVVAFIIFAGFTSCESETRRVIYFAQERETGPHVYFHQDASPIPRTGVVSSEGETTIVLDATVLNCSIGIRGKSSRSSPIQLVSLATFVDARVGVLPPRQSSDVDFLVEQMRDGVSIEEALRRKDDQAMERSGLTPDQVSRYRDLAASDLDANRAHPLLSRVLRAGGGEHLDLHWGGIALWVVLVFGFPVWHIGNGLRRWIRSRSLNSSKFEFSDTNGSEPI